MKRTSLIISVLSLAVLFMSGGRALAFAPRPDGGGSIAADSPVPNSLAWNPPTSYPSDSQGVGGQYQPYLVIGNSSDYSYTNNNLKIFVQKGQNLTINIINAGADCHIAGISGGTGLTGPDYSSNVASQGPMTVFQMADGANNYFGPIKVTAHNDCSIQTFVISASQCGLIPNLKDRPENFDGYCYLHAQVDLNDSVKGENSFQISVATNTGESAAGLGGLLTGYGFRDQNLNNGNHWTTQILFSADQTCNNTSNGTQPARVAGDIYYGDIDPPNTSSGAAWNPNIEVKLQQEETGQSGKWVTIVDRGPAQLNTFGNGKVLLSQRTFDSDHIYRLVLMNVGVRNTIFLQITNGLSQMAAKYQMTPSDCGSIGQGLSCTATPATQTVNTGTGATITVTLKNSGTLDVPAGYQMRQTSPSGGANTLTSNLAPGASRSFTYNISARGSPTSITFYYALFDGTDSGSKSVGTNPMCHAQISWQTSGCTSNCGPPPNQPTPPDITANCQNVTVSGGKSLATYQKSNPAGPYQTTVPPSQWSLYPYPPGPPNAGSNPFNLPTYTYTPPAGSTYLSPPAPITKMPIKIEMDGNGIAQTYYTWLGNGTNDSKNIDTFNTWSQAWPHNDGYTVTVFYVASGNSTTYQDDGNYNTNPADYPDGSWQPGPTASVPVCLDAYCGNPNTVDAEPGQRANFVYGVHVINQTQKTFSANDGNGYSFGVTTGGGINSVQSVSASPDLRPGNPTDITVSFTARIDYTGTWGTTMKFKGSALSLAQLPGGSCGLGSTGSPGGSTPYTRPFFEVRAGDLATGGCYQSASGSYNTANDPGYITPAPSNYSLNKNADSGGVRAFSNPSSSRGSKAEFGVDALGEIFQDTSRFYGFYSSSGVTFANLNTPNSFGGYLNSNSRAHCLMDFYDATRTGSQNGFSGGSVSGLPTGQYQANSDISISGGSIPHGVQITIYVNGDVTINGNITNQANWDATNPKDVPFLAIIAKGNITLGPGVTQLDGLFIAQPNGAGDSTTSGSFSTCNSYCPSQLIVNGGVIAQEVDLLRSHGTLGPLEADPNGVGQNPGEIFNYSPAMVIGLPYFVQNTTQLNILEGLFSLPPVF